MVDEQTPQDSPGARLIIAESKLASADDPLFVAFLGPLTDMASAILLDPEIVHREVVVIWIGGVGYGGAEPPPRRSSSTCQRHRRRPTWCSAPASPSGRCRAASTRGLGRLRRARREDRRCRPAR